MLQTPPRSNTSATSSSRHPPPEGITSRRRLLASSISQLAHFLVTSCQRIGHEIFPSNLFCYPLLEIGNLTFRLILFLIVHAPHRSQFCPARLLQHGGFAFRIHLYFQMRQARTQSLAHTNNLATFIRMRLPLSRQILCLGLCLSVGSPSQTRGISPSSSLQARRA